MFRVFTNDVNSTFASHDFAILTNFLSAGSYFHIFVNLIKIINCGLHAVSDAALGQIVGADLQFNLIARQESDLIHPHLSRQMR